MLQERGAYSVEGREDWGEGKIKRQGSRGGLYAVIRQARCNIIGRYIVERGNIAAEVFGGCDGGRRKIEE
jgi:hypothetical protein